MSLLRSFPNEQDEISCTYGVGCVEVTKKAQVACQVSTFDSLQLITQRTSSDVYQ